MEAPDGRPPGHVAGVAADLLVAAGAEGERALAGQHDHTHLGVLTGAIERLGELDQRLGPKRVAQLGPVDRDLGDAVRELVADVLVVPAAGLPGGRGLDLALRLLLGPGGGHFVHKR